MVTEGQARGPQIPRGDGKAQALYSAFMLCADYALYIRYLGTYVAWYIGKKLLIYTHIHIHRLLLWRRPDDARPASLFCTLLAVLVSDWASFTTAAAVPLDEAVGFGAPVVVL